MKKLLLASAITLSLSLAPVFAGNPTAPRLDPPVTEPVKPRCYIPIVNWTIRCGSVGSSVPQDPDNGEGPTPRSSVIDDIVEWTEQETPEPEPYDC